VKYWNKEETFKKINRVITQTFPYPNEKAKNKQRKKNPRLNITSIQNTKNFLFQEERKFMPKKKKTKNKTHRDDNFA
jgi:hypothetical protein